MGSTYVQVRRVPTPQGEAALSRQAAGDNRCGRSSDVSSADELAPAFSAKRHPLSLALPFADQRADLLLERVEVEAPLLLERVLEEGGVPIDCGRIWEEVNKRAPAIRARAFRAHRNQMADTVRVIKELTG